MKGVSIMKTLITASILGLAIALLIFGMASGDGKKTATGVVVTNNPQTQVQKAKNTSPPPAEPAAPTLDPQTGEEINWQVVSSGGTKSSSPNYVLQGTTGQTATGTGTSTNYAANHGFWQEFEPTLMCGDVDTSGVFDFIDMALFEFYFRTGESPTMPLTIGDVDQCGSINLADYTYVHDYFFEFGPFPCEGSVTCEWPVGTNSIDLGDQIVASPGDTVFMPVYITNDIPLQGVLVGFSYNSDDVEVIGVNEVETTFDWAQGFNWVIDEAANTVLIVATTGGFVTNNPQSGGEFAEIAIEISVGASDQNVDIDTLFINPAGEIVFCHDDGGIVSPAYNDNGTADLIISSGSSYVCGDADGSGAVDIDDVVYLIAYIFSGGPAPDPLASGDADCAGGIDIDDVVYLISYIFTGGSAPCDPDGDEVPDC